MKRLILVDACNLLHRLPEFSNRLHEGMDLLAEQLLQNIRCLHDFENIELHLIVDGKGQALTQQFLDDSRTLSIIYSGDEQTADTIIETWLLKLDKNWNVSVASEDRAIAHSAISNHADVLSASQLMEWAARVQKRFQRTNQIVSRQSGKDFGNRLEGLP